MEYGGNRNRPDAKGIQRIEQQDRTGAAGSKEVCTEHDAALVPTVCQCACREAEEDGGQEDAERQRRQAGGGAGLMVDPNGQGIFGHGGAQRGNGLGTP